MLGERVQRTNTNDPPLLDGQSFIEVQFPIGKLSKECYKERISSSQTLTGLGKWWGRKPLILVRAALIGLLMPASDDPAADRSVFLKLLTMDEDGLWLRRTKSIIPGRLYEIASRSDSHYGHRQCQTGRRLDSWFDRPEDNDGKAAWRPEVSREERTEITRRIFERLGYEEKLEFCVRPEQLEGPHDGAWGAINAHLDTHATCLRELVGELGARRFNHVPRLGDAFCGGGSIPFETARLGCEVYASDLNPVAGLLTWSSLYIVGGDNQVASEVEKARNQLIAAVDRQITEWCIETNAKGWRADQYFYCYETTCPECGWRIPLAGSWALAERAQKVVALLAPDAATRSLKISIKSGATAEEVRYAKQAATVVDGEVRCPSPVCAKREIPTRIKVSTLRGDRRKGKGEVDYGIRAWDPDQIVAGSHDLYHERLYCIRWLKPQEGRRGRDSEWVYRAPDADDMAREQTVLDLLTERFDGWQARGIVPSMAIRPGAKTTPLRRDLGATYWHHLFNPRQLLVLALMMETIERSTSESLIRGASLLLSMGFAVNFGSRLSRNNPSCDKAHETLYTQAFGAVYNYVCRASLSLASIMGIPASTHDCMPNAQVLVDDARYPTTICDVWITDPPYADAINYHELCDFFLAWYRGPLQKLFPEWHSDGRHALAVVGKEEQFRSSMADIYRAFTVKMPDNGMQVVMFTHSDAGVWADLVMILWSAGLQVTAAWCISTETGSDVAQKENGNYVQGTVLLVLRKRTSSHTVFLDELFPLVEKEVRRQLDQMRALEDARDPNFSDPDYQLAAYAAAMKVLTAYSAIEDFDVTRELNRPRMKGEVSPIEQLIRQAVETACNHLIPDGIDSFTWKQLTPGERYYLKGLDLESRGAGNLSAYQELARGFRFTDYKPILHQKANDARLRTATELARKGVGDEGFGQSLVRMAMAAVYDSVKREDARAGHNWLRVELADYWNRRRILVEVLQFTGRLADALPHWQTDGQMARVLAGAIENDHV